jgi:hypothetical protein
VCSFVCLCCSQKVERSLRVLDGVAIVIDAVAGVQAQTETVWRQACNYDLPALAFINKVSCKSNRIKLKIESVSQPPQNAILKCKHKHAFIFFFSIALFYFCLFLSLFYFYLKKKKKKDGSRWCGLQKRFEKFKISPWRGMPSTAVSHLQK